MKRKRTAALLLLLFLLAPLLFPQSAAAAESAGSDAEWDFSGGPDGVIGDFMAASGLNEENFAMGWYDTVSGEEWYYNPDAFFVAGSLYKLPLNMIYADRLADGEVTEKDYAGGWQIGTAMRASIVKSDNAAAQALRRGLGLDNTAYRDRMAQYSGLDASELPSSYYTDNCMSPRFMINTLRALYGDADKYAAVIDYMKQALPGHYFRLTQGEYEIAHKYGSFEGAKNDCGIVYTPRPFLLVVFLRAGRGEQYLGELCRIMTAYSLYLSETEGASPAPAAAAAPAEPEETPPAETKETPPAAPEATPRAKPAAADTRSRPTRSSWTLSFAGDCTIATMHEWQNQRSAANILYVIGENYGYTFENVLPFFEDDDFTMVNLEGAFTDSTACRRKPYRFRASPAYAQTLTAGSVEAVTLANNHTLDYLEQGLEDTKAALDELGVLWTDSETPLITTLDGGLKLGVISFNAVEIDIRVGQVDAYMERILPRYEQCREAGCDLVLAFIHWGWEYHKAPEGWMKDFAHRLADMGCDLVVGSHPHILVPMEVYKDVPIFYSLGNFCYGGHSNPADKDSVILRQQVVWDEKDGFSLGQTELIPCCISSNSRNNDFKPTPYEEGSAEYARVLEKLGVTE